MVFIVFVSKKAIRTEKSLLPEDRCGYNAMASLVGLHSTGVPKIRGQFAILDVCWAKS
jgi:hypothetical protein